MCGKGYYNVAKPPLSIRVLYGAVYVAVVLGCLCYMIEFVIHSVGKSEVNVISIFWFGVTALVFLLFVDRMKWSKPFHKRNKELNLCLVFSAAATAFCDYYKTNMINAWGTNAGIRDYVAVAVLVGGGIILVLILMFKTRDSLKKGL